jgi:hypothetical protein
VLFLLKDGSGRAAVVHLTWRGSTEKDPKWPWTTIFDDLDVWAEECMKPDHREDLSKRDQQ